MNKIIKIALGAALPVLWAAGCSDFLKGGELSNNPNSPVSGVATASQLFISIQSNNFALNEGELPRSISQWMQQLVGAQRQQTTVMDYTGITNSTYDGDFQAPYIGGGLIDLRVLETKSQAANDLLYLGIAQTMEAWIMSQTADMWGDIPYSQAVNFVQFPTPILDKQQDVYTATIALLNTAITNLGGAGGGPGNVDLVYHGNSAQWIALAHTLKARIFMHQAEKLGAAMYDSAFANANLVGITANSGDYLAWHASGIQLSSNLEWQFMAAAGGTGRAGDLVASTKGITSTQVNSKLWNYMLATADTRWPLYFDSTNSGDGNMSTARLSDGFPQPLVTANENDLIIAEAALHKTAPNAGAAAAALASEVGRWATAQTWHAAAVVPVPGVTNDSTIMYEKWILLFQNPETWNDWKRTCKPHLVPVSSLPQWGNTVVSRVLYGITEQQTNNNIPPVGTAPNGAFNWNDPNVCP